MRRQPHEAQVMKWHPNKLSVHGFNPGTLAQFCVCSLVMYLYAQAMLIESSVLAVLLGWMRPTLMLWTL